MSDKTKIGQLSPTAKGYYIVALPEITGNREYYPLYIGPIDSYGNMLEASKTKREEHYIIYWDGIRQYIIQH
jgi:hypothetical protein